LPNDKRKKRDERLIQWHAMHWAEANYI
jgi:hypothetical protein